MSVFPFPVDLWLGMDANRVIHFVDMTITVGVNQFDIINEHGQGEIYCQKIDHFVGRYSTNC